MDSSAGNYKSDMNRKGPFLALLQNMLGIFNWLVGFFTLTEEDRITAGISLGDKRRDG